LEAYRDTVRALPSQPKGPDALVTEAQETLEQAGVAREAIGEAQAGLEGRTPTELPVISSRPPLRQAMEVQEAMQAFYTEALGVVADIESVSDFVIELSDAFPQLANLDDAVSRIRSGGEVSQGVAAAEPVAGQLIADLESLTPPDELGATHSALVAIARRIRNDLNQMDRAAAQGPSPVINALLDDVEAEIATFRDTVTDAGQAARDEALSAEIREAGVLSDQIELGLRSLQDDIGGLTIPEG
jgi:hypothetical protein